MNMNTVWVKSALDAKHEHIRKVDVDSETGHVNISAFSIGPRGSVVFGMPGFTKNEWTEIVNAVSNEVSKTKPVTRPTAHAKAEELNAAPPKPVKLDSRICFAIAYFTSEADADAYAAFVRKRGDTYNGGWYDGMPCGREKHRDYVDQTLGQLYAVTT